MDNHPIPQDITGFQFKLIGNMTVRQFAYLAAGVILGWIFYSLPIFFFIKYPLAFLFVLCGILFAFIPLEGRPFDTMLFLFVKSLFTPNQYVFQKVGGQILQVDLSPKQPTQKKPTTVESEEKLQGFLKHLPKSPKNKLDQKEMEFFEAVSALPQTPPPPPKQPLPSATPQFISMEEEGEEKKQKEEPKEEFEKSELEIKKAQELEKEAQTLEKELEVAKKGEETQKASDLQRQLNEVLGQREQLEKEILALQKKLESQKQNVFVPSMAAPKEETQNVRKIPKVMGKNVGLPITPDVPNLIIGIIKNPRGNVLPNILVEVKDKEDNPVRAFKTNAVGQFASATPLQNGVYTILFEDPEGKNKFDAIELAANGQIIPVLEVISKDEREDLRKALFS